MQKKFLDDDDDDEEESIKCVPNFKIKSNKRKMKR